MQQPFMEKIRKNPRTEIEKQADEFLFITNKRNERHEPYPIMTRDRFRGIIRHEVVSLDSMSQD